MMAARVGRLKVFYALAARGEEKNRQKKHAPRNFPIFEKCRQIKSCLIFQETYRLLKD